MSVKLVPSTHEAIRVDSDGAKAGSFEAQTLNRTLPGGSQVLAAAGQFSVTPQTALAALPAVARPANSGARVHRPVAVAVVQVDCADSQASPSSKDVTR